MSSLLPTPITPPGIDVIQSIRTEAVPVVIPVLTPIVLGPCFKVLETTNSDGSLNEDARLELPAMYMPQTFVGRVPATDASGIVAAPGEILTLAVNGGGALTVTFSLAGGVTYTLNQMVTAINTAAAAAGSSLVAEVVMVDATKGILRIRTTGVGAGQGLTAVWSGATVVLATYFSLPLTWASTGKNKYDGSRFLLSKDLLPDPWDLMDDLDIQESSVRAFLTTSTVVKKEQSRTEAVSRCGNSNLLMVDDGDGDGTTPILSFLSAPLLIPNDVEHTALLPTVAGLNAFDSTPTAAVLVTDIVGNWAVGVHTFQMSIDGWEKQTIVATPAVMPGGTLTTLELRDAINRRFPGRAESTGGDTTVTVTSLLFGREGVIWTEDNADTQDLFLFGAPGATTYGPVQRGTWQAVKVGDEVWVGGALFGAIVQILNAAAPARVKLDTEYALDYFTAGTGDAVDWFIMSKGLGSQMESLTGDPVDPSPELFVSDYFIQTRHDCLRGGKGEPMYRPITSTDVTAYDALFYKALRLDVTVKATTREAAPIQISGRDFTNLDLVMNPVDAQNPLGLGMYCALLNSGDTPVLGFGVDEISATYPEGTPAAYARALSALKGQRCYAMAPLTQDLEAGLYGLAHVLLMSNTRRKGERIMFFSAPIPTRGESELVGSGTEGNAATGVGVATFQTGLADLADLFIAAGATDAFPWTETTGIYLDVEGDANHYLVQSYAGATVTCAAGTAGNGFFKEAPLPTTVIIDKNFSIYVRGSLLVDSVGNPDRMAQAQAIGRRAAKFNSSRVALVAPGECEMTIGGLATRLPTCYLAAALAGLRCGNRPEQPINNIPIQGFTKVYSSTGYFDPEDMNQAAGFGVWWVENDDTMGTVITRQQLMTNPTSAKVRESSCVAALDWGTYCVRDSLRSLMGTMNMTPQSLDTFSMGLEGVFDFIVNQAKVWAKADITKFQQGPFAATPEDLAVGLGPGGEDEMLAEVEVGIWVPANKFRIRLYV